MTQILVGCPAVTRVENEATQHYLAKYIQTVEFCCLSFLDLLMDNYDKQLFTYFQSRYVLKCNFSVHFSMFFNQRNVPTEGNAAKQGKVRFTCHSEPNVASGVGGCVTFF